MHDLDGHLLFKLSIRAFGKVNLTHPAHAQGAQHPIRPYAISHHFWSMHPVTGDLQTSALAAGCCLRV